MHNLQLKTEQNEKGIKALDCEKQLNHLKDLAEQYGIFDNYRDIFSQLPSDKQYHEKVVRDLKNLGETKVKDFFKRYPENDSQTIVDILRDLHKNGNLKLNRNTMTIRVS